jgi:hypothetical protein
LSVLDGNQRHVGTLDYRMSDLSMDQQPTLCDRVRTRPCGVSRVPEIFVGSVDRQSGLGEERQRE